VAVVYLSARQCEGLIDKINKYSDSRFLYV
jgi:hypothetical protein